ncbi:hypothetical protein [Streptomyces sp. NBRC 110035]|uniref:hypothetical protein n=1 Tax=Streptomyces sp. NBRC 110035 TaxID=1547867 RepID=UPI0018FEB349|nr:hypothetical protein [Streptomyces sp. NBRC 110035]
MSEQQTDPALTPAYRPADEPDLTPRPSKVLAEPSTVQACADDYADGGDVRRRLGWRR